jgi:PPP family 3-phenylpropionic acid transporter
MDTPESLPIIPPGDSLSQAGRGLKNIKVLYFSFFAAYGIFVNYINIYYQSIGLSGVQIGLINTIAPLVGIFSGTLWGLLHDRFGRARSLLLLATSGAIISVLGLSAVRTFVWMLPLAGFYSLFSSPIPPLLDNINLSLLGEERERYGRQRIWGSIGYIITSWGFGAVLEHFGLHYLFGGYAVAMLVLWAATLGLSNRPVVLPGPLGKGLAQMVRQRAWLVFAASAFLMWMASSGMYTFLGIYIKSLGGTDSLVGATSSLAAISETPVMFFSALLVRRFGPKRLITLALLLYGVRMLFYGLMPSPYWTLPISLMHGSTFGFFWIAGVNYVNRVLNLANVVGSPISGLLFDRVGPAILFMVFSGYCLAGFACFWLGNRIWARTQHLTGLGDL